ncbi:NAD(P)H-binding protein [Mycobacterium sp. CBMA293]|uniref:NmrA family NAD(P)-binding protein n=1 Tax=unclassified Mycolicibacterium TaxID=2636767 RepID=UPI0012DBD595|nr:MULTISPECIES: NmrA family NAD(P)-binding protein [unclassified Mycolicibacterium]MUL50157.1 NAD(P)H-binding protein [Mycolicibacterium sp. CBMA 360]MUL62809.1 NAD(P)H-binding protein [Mycolicibacterium sp. CBMA 335]MUL71993.1 NAD(P)H-binding protein [Mycolicibacterium sp. CBMA 311]MUL97452.1 NAD(P)H-binding protein [Mycolicibacterium sp. CBMA 230]MUM03860.1 hypothetical protein [Mycolicibacterium sp. CBMA 213]
MNRSIRPAPERVLVFGASGHVGGPLAEKVAAQPAGPILRVATSTQDKAADLQARFPTAEVVVANYLDLPSLITAFDGVDAAFVITPDFKIDERKAMFHVAAAVHNAGRDAHIVKLVGVTIGINSANDLRAAMRDYPGSSLQAQQCRAALNASGLPVSYLNSFAYFMDGIFDVWMPPLRERRTLSAPFDRSTSFVDTRDLGDAAAKLLLEPHDREHDGYMHHVTGTERLRFSEIAPMLTDILGIEIAYEDDPVAFKAEIEESANEHYGPGAADYFVAWGENELKEEPLFIITDELQHLIGRKPRSMRDWIEEHKSEILAQLSR